jgi:hypothetical protein
MANKELNMGNLSVTRKGKVYGPGMALVPENLFDDVQERLYSLQKKRQSNLSSSESEEVDLLKLETDEEENQNSGGESDEDQEPEVEIPTLEELSKKSRSYLESQAEGLGITNVKDFANREQLAQAIIDAMEDDADTSEADDSEEEDEEEDEE